MTLLTKMKSEVENVLATLDESMRRAVVDVPPKEPELLYTQSALETMDASQFLALAVRLVGRVRKPTCPPLKLTPSSENTPQFAATQDVDGKSDLPRP